MNRTTFLIDGFNLYHLLVDASRDLKNASTKWLNMKSLCDSCLAAIRFQATRHDLFFERYNVVYENDLKRACEKLYAFHEEARNLVEETAAGTNSGTISIIKKSLEKK